jgi:integrase
MEKARHWTDAKLAAVRLKRGTTERRVSVDSTLYLRLRDRPQRGGLSRTWEYRAQVDGRRKYLNLGEYAHGQGLAWARAKLAPLLVQEDQARKGEADHPVTTEKYRRDGRKSDPTVAEVFDLWLDDLALRQRRESTIALQRANFDADIRARIGDAKVGKIEVEALRACINGPKKRGALGQAAQVYKTLRGLINFALKEGYLKADPLASVENPKPYNPRQGSANAADDRGIVALYRTLDDPASRIHRAVKLAIVFQLLTGARPTEVREARWQEIDRDTRLWRLPAERVKTGRAFDVHLSPQALRVLDQAAELDPARTGYLFPGRAAGQALSNLAITRALARLSARNPAARRLAPHDLRRTFRTVLSRIGVAPHVAERCLNHADPSALARAYDAFDYRREMVEAWERAGAHIEAITTGGAEVIALRAA